jgi:hypothetical protein
MRQPVDLVLLDEIGRHDLRFTCPDCLYFIRERASCAHGWPNADHLRIPVARDLEAGGKELVFCKEFEIG